MEKMKSRSRIVIAIIIFIMLVLAIISICIRNSSGVPTVSKDQSINNDEATTLPDEIEYQYEEGNLCTIVDETGNPKQNEFVIDGLILAGNQHKYGDDSASDIESLLVDGYKVEGINSSFYLDEYIQFYIYTSYEGSEEDVKILVTPHNSVEEYEKMSYDQLNDLAKTKGFVLDYKKPDLENNRFVGENYVNGDYPEGKYDILFTYKGKLAYYININETKEPKK